MTQNRLYFKHMQVIFIVPKPIFLFKVEFWRAILFKKDLKGKNLYFQSDVGYSFYFLVQHRRIIFLLYRIRPASPFI